MDKKALIFQKYSISYEELDYETNKLAEQLILVAHGADIAFQLKNPYEMALLVLAAFKTACRVFLLHPSSPEIRISYIKEKGIPVIQNISELKNKRGEVKLPEECSGSLVFSTSNTTSSESHWVEIPMKTMKTKAELIKEVLQINSSDYTYFVSPLCFIQACWTLLVHIISRATVEIDFFSVNGLAKALSSGNVTNIITVPSVARCLAERIDDIGKMKLLGLGGDYVSPDLIKCIKNRWPHLFFANIYGCTETSAADLIMGPVRLRDSGTMCFSLGKPNRYSEVSIRDETLHDCPVGQYGNIWIKSPFICSHYLWDEKTIVHEQYGFCTGDIGYVSEDGYYFYIGRKQTVIKINGMKVSALEVEEALLKNPEIAEAVVFPIKDVKKSYVLGCLVVLKSAINKNDLKERLEYFLEPYKIPEYYYRCDRLPKTVSGKMIRVTERLILAATEVLG